MPKRRRTRRMNEYQLPPSRGYHVSPLWCDRLAAFPLSRHQSSDARGVLLLLCGVFLAAAITGQRSAVVKLPPFWPPHPTAFLFCWMQNGPYFILVLSPLAGNVYPDSSRGPFNSASSTTSAQPQSNSRFYWRRVRGNLGFSSFSPAVVCFRATFLSFVSFLTCPIRNFFSYTSHPPLLPTIP